MPAARQIVPQVIGRALNGQSAVFNALLVLVDEHENMRGSWIYQLGAFHSVACRPVNSVVTAHVTFQSIAEIAGLPSTPNCRSIRGTMINTKGWVVAELRSSDNVGGTDVSCISNYPAIYSTTCTIAPDVIP